MPTPGSDSARSPISQAGSHGDRHGDCAAVTVTAKPPSQARPGLGPGAHNDSSWQGIRVTVIRVMTPVNPMISDSRAGPGPDRDWFWSDNLPVTRTSTGRLRVGLPLCPLACRPGPCPCSPRFRRAAGPVRRRRTSAFPAPGWHSESMCQQALAGHHEKSASLPEPASTSVLAGADSEMFSLLTPCT